MPVARLTGEGHLRFSGACRAFQENRLIVSPASIDRVGYFVSSEIANLFERGEGVFSVSEHIIAT